MKAVIPAAGLGLRFLPYTKAQPKEMIPVVDKPAIQYVVEEAAESGVRDILIVTGRGKLAIEDHFDVNPDMDYYVTAYGGSSALESLRQLMRTVRIMYVRQPAPKGLGDAISHAESFVAREPFAVLLGDDITMNPPCLRMLIEAYHRLKASVVALQVVPGEQIRRYGIAAGDEVEPSLYRLTDLVEKPSQEETRSNLAIIGRYVFTPSFFDALRSTPVGKGGEIQLTDAIQLQLEREPVYGLIYPGKRYDVGDRVGWLQANLELALLQDESREALAGILHRLRGEGAELGL